MLNRLLICALLENCLDIIRISMCSYLLFFILIIYSQFILANMIFMDLFTEYLVLDGNLARVAFDDLSIELC